MDPALAAALAHYLAANCSGSVSLQCAPGGPPIAPGGACPPRRPQPSGGCGCDGGDTQTDCAIVCPEPDYGDPDQPYFWDHTSMRN